MFSMLDTQLGLASTLALALAFAPGCGDDSGGGDTDSANSDGGSDPSSADSDSAPANCATRCEDKAVDCQAPDDVASSQCAMICGGGVTDEQLECLEDSSCEELGMAFLGGAPICDIGGGNGSGGSGNGSGGSGNGSGSNASIGDACECSDTPGDFESCSGTDSTCGDLTCYVFGGEGICSQPCTADGNGGDDCPSGECVDHLLSPTLSVGSWCE